MFTAGDFNLTTADSARIEHSGRTHKKCLARRLSQVSKLCQSLDMTLELLSAIRLDQSSHFFFLPAGQLSLRLPNFLLNKSLFCRTPPISQHYHLGTFLSDRMKWTGAGVEWFTLVPGSILSRYAFQCGIEQATIQQLINTVTSNKKKKKKKKKKKNF